MKAYIDNSFFEFFKKLAANNNKDWFDENRKWYEESVKAPFENLCEAVIKELVIKDIGFATLRPRDVIFRINRDIRFATDKTPYKLNRSANFALGGRKEMGPGGFYLEMGPGGNAFYAGVYMPEKADLMKIREHIAQHLSEFQKLINSHEFKNTFGEVLGEKNKRIDATLKAAGENEPLVYNTQFYIKHEISEAICLSKNAVAYLMELHGKAAAFAEFMGQAMGK